jgi:hypothetical protein
MKIQDYLNNKYPTPEDKAQVIKITTAEITKFLAGGELDLREFKNLEAVIITDLTTPLTKIEVEGLTKLKELILPEKQEETESEKKLYEELGISNEGAKKKVVQEVQRLADLKAVKINFGEAKEGSEGIFLNLEQKDKSGNFCPSLVFWTLAQAFLSEKTPEKNPDFWKDFQQELGWVKDNLAENYRKDLELLLTPTTFPTNQLEMKEFLTFYYPNRETITDNQTIKTLVKSEIVNQTWQNIGSELAELTSQEVKKNPGEEKLKDLTWKATIDYNSSEYTIQVQYHPQNPNQNKIKELITLTPLQLEIEYLKQKQEQLPTAENFIKLTQEKQELEKCLQDLTDEEEFNKIKNKIKQIK